MLRTKRLSSKGAETPEPEYRSRSEYFFEKKIEQEMLKPRVLNFNFGQIMLVIFLGSRASI